MPSDSPWPCHIHKPKLPINSSSVPELLYFFNSAQRSSKVALDTMLLSTCWNSTVYPTAEAAPSAPAFSSIHSGQYTDTDKC